MSPARFTASAPLLGSLALACLIFADPASVSIEDKRSRHISNEGPSVTSDWAARLSVQRIVDATFEDLIEALPPLFGESATTPPSYSTSVPENPIVANIGFAFRDLREPPSGPATMAVGGIASDESARGQDSVQAHSTVEDTAADTVISPVCNGAAPPDSPARLVSLFRPQAIEGDLKPVAPLLETPNECLVAEICIDEYLWALYQRTPKVDTNKVAERIAVVVKKKGKTRTLVKLVTRYAAADFTWKDPIAAERAGMSVKDYVIGGMDAAFKLKLYYALRAMENAGLVPGITSAFRDDYRQEIASGKKAASDSSYHGGSRRGGYGHGLAADLVSVKGENRVERYASTIEMWKWIDTHEKDLGIGRPYLDRDPPHVGPLDGQEYAAKRGLKGRSAVSTTTKDHALVDRRLASTKPVARAVQRVRGRGFSRAGRLAEAF